MRNNLKVLFLLTIGILFNHGIEAQENQLEIFSEMGEEFTLYLNGAQKNEEPVSNIILKDLTSASYKARIVFVKKSQGMFLDNVYAPKNMGDSGRNTYVIKKSRKGNYKLKFQSFTPMNELPAEEPEFEPAPTYAETESINTTINQEVNTTTTTSTTVQSDEVNMSVSMGGQEFGVNVSTTSTSSSDVNMDMNVDMNMDVQTTEQSYTQTTTEMEPMSSGYGCDPMTYGDFSSALSSIQSKSFEDSKLQMAEQIMNSNCLTSEQVHDIMKSFDFEETRLDFAKKAYSKVYDQNNYYKVNDAFDFETSIVELDEDIEYQRNR